MLVKKPRQAENGGCREYVEVHLPELSSWQNHDHNRFYETEILNEATVAQEFSGMGTEAPWHTWEMNIPMANIGSHTLCQYVLVEKIPTENHCFHQELPLLLESFQWIITFPAFGWMTHTEHSSPTSQYQNLLGSLRGSFSPGWQFGGPNGWWNLGLKSHQFMPLYKM